MACGALRDVRVVGSAAFLAASSCFCDAPKAEGWGGDVEHVVIPFAIPAQKMKVITDVQPWGIVFGAESMDKCLSVFSSCAVRVGRNFMDGTTFLSGEVTVPVLTESNFDLSLKAGMWTDMHNFSGSAGAVLTVPLGNDWRMEISGTMPWNEEKGFDKGAVSGFARVTLPF